MKKKRLVFLAALAFIGIFVSFVSDSKASAAETPAVMPIRRLYNPNSGEHLFTPSNYERATLINYGWKDEGVAFNGMGYSPNASPKYFLNRVYNPNAGDHHYTVSNEEVAMLLKAGWHDDNIGFYTANDGQGQPVYRLYNPNAIAGAHHFTLDLSERNHLIKVGWKDEGIGFRAW